ncbi:Seryl-tRNA synthetase [Candidatus Nasuia deltocephalinicola]|nr:Seryl-tRNA synthetase [Candidatus Nasuia deltocephalinicola]
MLNEKFLKKNLKSISIKLKNNLYILNKKLFNITYLIKKYIINIINNLNKNNKNNKYKNIILDKFFIKKFKKIYKNFYIKINNKIKNIILNIPNIKNKEVSNYNKLIKYWKFKKKNNNKENHIKIGSYLGLNIKLGINISGYKSIFLSGPILYLYKSIIKFIINIHIKEHNYKEIKVPYIINYNNIINSGQLPKFINNIFKINNNKYLIPTAEVIIINSIKNKKIKNNLLPIKLFSKTECFRKENKNYGIKNKGIIRQNQFEKIELIIFSDQKNSYNNLKELIKTIEKFIRKLKIKYRIILLSYKNTGFTSSKTFDIEIWMPSINNFCEISSCSNTEIYQSNRTNLKYINKDKIKFVHILNGSALPLGRTLAAIMENYFYKKKYIIIPKILRKYMNKKHIIKIK